MANELLKAQIEAALFLTEKPLRAAAVAQIVNADVNVVRQTIIELIHDYESRNGGLEVTDEDGYIIQVKDEYTNLVDTFVPIDMPTALIRTLSAIAIKQPVLQSEVIKLRGAGAYDHIKDLLTRELINKREEGGRSPILTTTKKFQEYFRLSKDGKSFRNEMTTPKVAAVEGGEPTQDQELRQIIADSQVFDASPDPDTPPIGISGLTDNDDEHAIAEAFAEEDSSKQARSETSNVTADDREAELDLSGVILEDVDTDAVAKVVAAEVEVEAADDSDEDEAEEETVSDGAKKVEADGDTGFDVTLEAVASKSSTESDVNTAGDVISPNFNTATEASTSQ